MTFDMNAVYIPTDQAAASQAYSQSYGSSVSSSPGSRICYSRDQLLALASSPLAQSPPNFHKSTLPDLIAKKKQAPASPTVEDNTPEEQFNLEL